PGAVPVVVAPGAARDAVRPRAGARPVVNVDDLLAGALPTWVCAATHRRRPRAAPASLPDAPPTRTDDERRRGLGATLVCCHPRLQRRPAFGASFWGQVRGYPKVLQGRGAPNKKPPELQGKRSTTRVPRSHSRRRQLPW